MALPAQIEQPIPNKLVCSAHSSDSSLREQALGHIFLGQLLAFMWRNNARDIEVLKSEVDRGGYDVVLESGGVIRHVRRNTKSYDILAGRPDCQDLRKVPVKTVRTQPWYVKQASFKGDLLEQVTIRSDRQGRFDCARSLLYCAQPGCSR
jgi:hypothetical protein